MHRSSALPADDPIGLEAVHPSWVPVLAPLRHRLEAISAALLAEDAAGRSWLPAPEHVLRAFQRPLGDVRVLLVGQDPYPTPGHAVGLAFSVAPGTPLPRSLANVLREMRDDVGAYLPDGDLSAWAEQGVLLLNRVLTVRAGEPASHQGLGWQEVTEAAVRALVDRGGPLVAVLWGRHAQTLQPLLPGVPTVTSAHPSPLSAARGFFGSRPFSQVDAHLREQGAPPIRWDGARP